MVLVVPAPPPRRFREEKWPAPVATLFVLSVTFILWAAVFKGGDALLSLIFG